jgi:molybdopterin molybdotransferase
VRIETTDDGHVKALKHHSSGAGILTSMVDADGLVEMPEDVVRLEAGEIVTYIPFNGLIAG